MGNRLVTNAAAVGLAPEVLERFASALPEPSGDRDEEVGMEMVNG